jgi:hypothetical protein
MDWRIFETSLKTEARIFNGMQVNDLTPIFDSIGALQSRDGYPLVVDAGPETNFHISYQVFQSDDNFECKCIPTNSGSPRLAIRTRLNEGRPSQRNERQRGNRHSMVY